MTRRGDAARGGDQSRARATRSSTVYGHDHGHVVPSSLSQQAGRALEFSDVGGKPIRPADFGGKWTLLFFGYSRCRASCPVAIPKIVRTADRLRSAGIPARAVFVDIDVPPLGVVRFRRPGAAIANGHGPAVHHDHGDLDRVAAMRALTRQFAGRLVVATGTRAQLGAATRAFQVAREHVPPRDGEKGHSINHSSMIYLIAPDCRVAGQFGHDAALSRIYDGVSLIARRSAAPTLAPGHDQRRS